MPVMQDLQSQMAEAAQQQSLQLPSLYESITTDKHGSEQVSHKGSGWTRGRSQGWTGGGLGSRLHGQRGLGTGSHNSDVPATNLQVSLPETAVAAVPARTASDQDSQSASESCVMVTAPERARRSLSEHDGDRDIESALESPNYPSSNAPFTPQVQHGRNLGTRSTITNSSPPTTTMQIRQPSMTENGIPSENAPQDPHSVLLHHEPESDIAFHVERDSGWKDSLAEVELLLHQVEAPIRCLRETLHRVQAEMTAMRSERERVDGEKITLQANLHRLSTAYEQVKDDVSGKDAKIIDLEQSKRVGVDEW